MEKKKLGRHHGPVSEPYYDGAGFLIAACLPILLFQGQHWKWQPQRRRIIHLLSFHMSGECRTFVQWPYQFVGIVSNRSDRSTSAFLTVAPGSRASRKRHQKLLQEFLSQSKRWWKTYSFALGGLVQPLLTFWRLLLYVHSSKAIGYN